MKKSLNQIENNKSLIEIFHKLLEGRYLRVFIICIACGILSFVFSLFLPKEYQSETLIYPSNTNLSEGLLHEGVKFGSEKEVQEHIQILKSDQLRDSVINVFSLIKYFGLKEENKTILKYKTDKKYQKNVVISRNTNGSISVFVLDKDAQMAATLANSIVEIANGIKSNILKKNIAKAHEDALLELSEKSIEVKKIISNANDLKLSNYSNAIKFQEDHLRIAQDKKRRSFKEMKNLNSRTSVLNYHESYSLLFESYIEAQNAKQYYNGELKSLNDMNLNKNDTIYINTKKRYSGAKQRFDSLQIDFNSWKESNGNYSTLKELENEVDLQNDILSDLERKYNNDKSSIDKTYHNFDLLAIERKIESELIILNQLKKKESKFRTMLKNKIPNSYVINYAIPSVIATNPRKKIIVMVTIFSAFLLQMLYFSLYKNS